MTDYLYRVTWKPGEITVHAPSAKAAVSIAIEYIQQAETNRITAQVVAPEPRIADQ